MILNFKEINRMNESYEESLQEKQDIIEKQRIEIQKLQKENDSLRQELKDFKNSKFSQLKSIQDTERELTNKFQLQIEELRKEYEKKSRQELEHAERQLSLIKSALTQEQESSVQLVKQVNELKKELVNIFINIFIYS